MVNPTLTPAARTAILLAAFGGLVFAGVQLGLMPLASLSVSRDLLGAKFSDGLAGDWFARYTAALMLGAAFGGIALGALGDRLGRTRALGVSVLLYSAFGGLGALARTQEQMLALRFLAGLGVGGAWPNAVALVAESWSNASRPMVAGIAGTGLNVGIFLVSQAVRVWHVAPESWRWLIGWSGAAAVLALAAFLVIPESPRWLLSKNTPGATGAMRELFTPPLRSRTLIGIALASIALLGAWGAGKWLVPWADKTGGLAHPGLKAATQGWWAFGAILGSFFGSHLANLAGRRTAYFFISLGATALTCGTFALLHPGDAAFLPVVFAQGFVSTLYFGWLPLYLPELFPTRVRATGSGIACNAGRIFTAAGVFAAGALIAAFHGDYARVGVITGLVYALGMIVIWFAPDTGGKPLEE